MRRKAVKAIVMHTKDSIQHLKDDDDEMLRGNPCKPAFTVTQPVRSAAICTCCVWKTYSGHSLKCTEPA